MRLLFAAGPIYNNGGAIGKHGDEGVLMIISDFTNVELEMLRRECNFVNTEKDVFELRSQGIPLELIAEILDMSVDGIKRISRKVNRKIFKVLY